MSDPSGKAVERVVVVTRKTPLEELVERFNSHAQARFYLEHAGGSMQEYEAAHERYQASVEALRHQLPRRLKQQFLERSFLTNYLFAESDLVLPIGPDGLVVNTAKYLTSQAILAVNPDPERVDGVLTPFAVAEVGEWLERAVAGRVRVQRVTMARASLNDGQTLHGFNDLFIGSRSHVSARYRIEVQGRAEDHCSSGIIVSTGAGSTGWLQSLVTGAVSVAAGITGQELSVPAPESYRLPWEAEELYFTVREPFTSRTSRASLVFGRLKAGETLRVRSLMPDAGVIFSDGLEEDYLSFNSGSVATIAVAERKAHLVVR